MENFDGNPNNMKEKSVYLLHLDTPRIIIISSIIIGIIVASFLFGMNYINDGNSSSNDIAKNNLMMKNNLPGMMNGTIPGPPDGGETLKSIDENSTMMKDSDINIQKETDEKTASLNGALDEKNPKNESVDILTNENINIIKPDKLKSGKTKIVKQKKQHTVIARKNRKIGKTPVRKRRNIASRKKSHNVVAVVNRVDRISPARGFFAIQVASYDTIGKALREKKKLKSMRYKAYISKQRVKGRLYYRVRVGPISSKRKAINKLGDMQEISRYQSCYLIKQ